MFSDDVIIYNPKENIMKFQETNDEEEEVTVTEKTLQEILQDPFPFVGG